MTAVPVAYLHADDWTTVTGRGRIAVVGSWPADLDIKQARGLVVSIDGDLYTIRGIECWATPNPSPPYGVLVTPWNPDDGPGYIYQAYTADRANTIHEHGPDREGLDADTLRSHHFHLTAIGYIVDVYTVDGIPVEPERLADLLAGIPEGPE